MLIIIAAIFIAPLIATTYAGIADAIDDAKFRKDFGIY